MILFRFQRATLRLSAGVGKGSEAIADAKHVLTDIDAAWPEVWQRFPVCE
jgi:hypothetical protein